MCDVHLGAWTQILLAGVPSGDPRSTIAALPIVRPCPASPLTALASSRVRERHYLNVSFMCSYVFEIVRSGYFSRADAFSPALALHPPSRRS